jgi:multiple sugar transport system permease protein/raffinose/stachyose/melibiose transport system permease protein
VLAAWLFLAPALAVIAVFTVVPFVQGILLSFQSWDGVSLDTPYIGLDNYRYVLHDTEFWGSMKNAVLYGVVGLVVANAVSMVMALAVHRARRGSGFFRTVYYLPGVFSTVVVGVMFSWFLDPNIGIVNQTLKAVGLDGLQHNWLGDPKTAVIAVAAVFVWYHWGFGFILFLAGRQDVPQELYEAASLVAGLQIFGTVQMLTNGGPAGHTEVPTLHIYQQAFQYSEYGRAAAMSVIFGLCLVALACVQLWVSRRLGGSTDSRTEKGR